MKSPDVRSGKKPAGHAATPHALPRAPRLRPFSLRNWPVSRRLIAVIVMAAVMGLVFGGLRVTAAARTAIGFARTSQLAALGEQVTVLAQALENERDLTAGYDAAGGWDQVPNTNGVCIVIPQSDCAEYGYAPAGPALPKGWATLTRAQAATDAAAARVRALASKIGSSFPAITQNKAQTVIEQIDNLGGLRSESAQQPSLSAIGYYSETISDLFDLNDEITSGSGDPQLADEVRTLDAMSRAKDQASQQRATLFGALVNGNFAQQSQQALLISGELENADLLSFESSATDNEVTSYLDNVSGLPVNAAELLNNYLQVAGAQAVNTPATSAKPGGGTMSALTHYTCALGSQYCTAVPQVYYTDMSTTIGKMRTVEQQLASQIVTRSQSLEHGARQSAEFTAEVTGGVLLLVLIATLIVARSLVEPLRRLQADALEVATVRLPERVAELSEASDPQAAMRIEPISVNSTDEIGKVARAFDQVHREALRLAGNEALLRGNLNTMFISLSRRSVPLIERLARMIDSLEQNEDDPDRLSNLFSMDHLVTRMRRNSENLLVLAGEEPVRKWSEPVPLADVARAASSEIEQYSRVVLNIQPGIVISGQAAADVVHLLAEIIENATMFSPRDTPVYVSGQELSSGGVLIEVSDSGVGVSPSRLSEMNWRLDNPPLIDVSVSRHMGLFAVSRLAARNGIRVRLRPVSPQGLSALVWLPGNLTGRETVWYGDGTQVTGQSPGQLKMAGRRISVRHRQGLGTADDGQPGIPARAAAPAITASNWFRPKRRSIAAVQEAAIGAPPQQAPASVPAYQASSASGQASGVDSSWPDGGRRDGGSRDARWGDGGSRDGRWGDGGWGDAGWREAEAAGGPVHGGQTAAGLPTRIPRANLFPGSVGGTPDRDASTAEIPVYRQAPAGYEPPTAGYETEPPAFPQPTAPSRSAERARTRLSGFQLGRRDAQGRTSRAGEDASR